MTVTASRRIRSCRSERPRSRVDLSFGAVVRCRGSVRSRLADATRSTALATLIRARRGVSLRRVRRWGKRPLRHPQGAKNGRYVVFPGDGFRAAGFRAPRPRVPVGPDGWQMSVRAHCQAHQPIRLNRVHAIYGWVAACSPGTPLSSSIRKRIESSHASSSFCSVA